LADAGEVPGGTRNNERFLASRVRWAAGVSPARQVVLNDAQTSGGLLIAVPEAASGRLLAELGQRAVEASVIGQLVQGEAGQIEVG
jgi:selenide, water dikinase